MGALLLRNWVLTLMATALTIMGVLVTVSHVQPDYRSTASVVLIPPKSVEEPTANRYLLLGSLDQAVGVVVNSLNSDQTKDTIAMKVPGAEYEVLADWTTSAPILSITVDGRSPAVAEAILQAVLDQVPEVLTTLQNSLSIEQSSMITSLDLTRADEPNLLLKPLLRAGIGVGVLLLAVFLSIIALADGLRQRRRARRALAPAATEVAGLDEDEVPAEPVVQTSHPVEPVIRQSVRRRPVRPQKTGVAQLRLPVQTLAELEDPEDDRDDDRARSAAR